MPSIGTDMSLMARVDDRDSLLQGISAVLIGVCGPTLFVVVPFFLSFVKQGRGFDESQISLIASADMLGMFIASGLAAFWIKQANWRHVSLASLALLILATLGSLYATSFTAFGLTRVAAGFGAGSLMGIGLTAMGDRTRADAWFGWFVAAQAVLGSATSWAIPRFVEPHGLQGLLISLIVIYALLIPAALLMPRHSRHKFAASAGVEAVTVGEFASLKLALLSLVAAFGFYMGVFAIWSHLDLIGRDAGIDPLQIGNALSIGYLLGIPASIGAVMLAGRLSRLAFFAVIAAIHLGALALLFLFPGLFGFTAATLMLGWLWYFAAPPQMGLTVSVDPSGRFIVLFVAAMKSSYVVAGAVLSVLLADGANLTRVILFSGICGLFSAAIYIALALRTTRRPVPRGAL